MELRPVDSAVTVLATASVGKYRARCGPAGIHLFDRTTGWNILLDEAIPPQRLWATVPQQVSIALTNACDLACPYCYAPKHRATLDASLLIGWLDELDANGCLGIGFGGGEPTVYRALPKVCRHAAEHTRLAVTFTTHAHRLDDALVDALSGCVHFVRVSMDGVGATYEALRGRSFDRLVTQLERVRKLCPFGINFVVNARTIVDIDRAVAVAASAGASEFLLLPELPVHGRGGIDMATTNRLHRWVNRYRGSIPLTISEAGAEKLSMPTISMGEAGLRAYAHISADGVLRRSSFEGPGVPISKSGIVAALVRLADEEDRES